jgi:hypothetical protein
MPKPQWIDIVNRITAHIGIPVHPVAVSDGIGLHEPAERGAVHPGFVIVHADLAEPCLARVAEPTEVRGRRDAIFVIGVDVGHGPARVADGDHATTFVGVEEAPVCGASTLIPDQRFIAARAVDVAALEDA